MQIYTKIFIGMALGIAFGLTLGPQSPLLGHDRISVNNPAKVRLLTRPGGPPQGIALPSLKSTRPTLHLHVFGSQRAGHKLYYDVSFRVNKRIALKDQSGRLELGKELRGWVEAGTLSDPISSLGDTLIGWIAPLGVLFLTLIKMVIVPLVFASLLVGVASLGDPRKLGRLGGKTIGYFLLTTTMAIFIGLALANVVKPGSFLSPEDRRNLVERYGGAAQSKTSSAAEQPSAVDNLLAIIPKNPMKSLAEGKMLQIIFFASFFGVALTLIERERAAKLISVFAAVNDAMVKLVELIMKLAPLGVFALVAEVTGQSGAGVLKALAIYGLVVVAGLFIHAFAIYTSVVRLFGKVRPMDFWRAIRPAQLIAFSTSSSSATLPVTMRCAEENLSISNRIASFVLPLGSTVNMDGTALYQGVAAIFVAQVFDIHLTVGDQLNIVLTATLASIGAAGVPGVGIVTLALVLTSIGVPTVGVALILGVDRVLDMFRTAVNVTGDMSATVLVAATEGERVTYRPPDVEERPRTATDGDATEP